jgi:hypothetical protein
MPEKDQPSELQQTASAPPIAEKHASQDVEWPRLLARVVEGIVTAELHEFEDNVRAFLDSVVANAYANFVWMCALTIGAGFILTGVVLFLGLFLPWWEAFTLVGLLVVAVGAFASSGRRRRPERRRSRRR